MQINDVLFSLHNFAVKVLLVIQCCIYDRGDQRVSNRMWALLNSTLSPALVLGLMLLFSQLKPLAFVYYFSYVKMGLTLAKYVPQLYLNKQRQSTSGFSIYTILMDFGGGVFSLGQMACLAINFGEHFYYFLLIKS